jgi:hypothetical protein
LNLPPPYCQNSGAATEAVEDVRPDAVVEAIYESYDQYDGSITAHPSKATAGGRTMSNGRAWKVYRPAADSRYDPIEQRSSTATT